jgi:T-complex protein 1 subunit theta
VISFAGELLKNAGELIKNGVHTSEIVTGYQLAFEKALEILPSLVVRTIDDVRNTNELKIGIRSVIGTKQCGYEDFLSELVVSACQTTFTNTTNKPKLNLDNVRLAKLRGGNILQSSVVKGMVILRDTEGTIKKIENSKVIVFGCGFEAGAAEAKSTVLLKNAEELMNYNKSEEKKMEDIVSSIAATGVKAVVVNGTVSEMALHFLEKYQILVLKIMSKFDLRRICGALGATAVLKLGPCSPEEMGEVTK